MPTARGLGRPRQLENAYPCANVKSQLLVHQVELPCTCREAPWMYVYVTSHQMPPVSPNTPMPPFPIPLLFFAPELNGRPRTP